MFDTFQTSISVISTGRPISARQYQPPKVRFGTSGAVLLALLALLQSNRRHVWLNCSTLLRVESDNGSDIYGLRSSMELIQVRSLVLNSWKPLSKLLGRNNSQLRVDTVDDCRNAMSSRHTPKRDVWPRCPLNMTAVRNRPSTRPSS